MSTFRYQTFNLNLLRVFDALYSERSVTRAAERLNLTQSAVSHALAHLREALGDDLFVRSGMKMTPTARADDVAPQIQKSLMNIRLALVPSEFDPLTSDRTFTIGTGDYGNHVLLPALARRLRELAPGTRLKVVPLSAQVIGWLDEGEVDVALSMFVSVPERMSSQALGETEDWLWVVREGHPLANGRSTSHQINEMGVVEVSLSSAFAAATNDGLVTHYSMFDNANEQQIAQTAIPDPIGNAKAPPYIIKVANYYAAMHLVSQSDMATLLPRRLFLGCAKQFSLGILYTDGELPRRTMTALWHNDYGERPAIRWLREQLQAIMSNLPPLASGG